MDNVFNPNGKNIRNKREAVSAKKPKMVDTDRKAANQSKKVNQAVGNTLTSNQRILRLRQLGYSNEFICSQENLVIPHNKTAKMVIDDIVGRE